MINKAKQRPIAIYMAFLIAVTTLFSTADAKPVQAAEETVLASWEITGKPASSTVPATGGTTAVTPVSGAAIGSISGAELSTNTTYNASDGYASNAMKTTGWNEGANKKYWQIALSSKGYEKLTLKAKTRSSNTGPRDFIIQYSTDGEKYTDITTYQNTTSLDYRFSTIMLPAEAANKDILIIRLTVGSNTSVDGKTIVETGVSNINSILIQGEPVESDNITATVKASIPSGEILSTDLIKLTSATGNASIFYSINGGEYRSYKNPFSITEFPAELKVKASADGVADSVVSVYKYIQAKVSAVTASPNGGAINAGRSIALQCSSEGAAIQYSLDEGKNWTTYTKEFVLSKLPARVLAKATLPGALDSEVNEFNYTQRKSEKYNFYFGQLHSHSNNSDGLGTVEEAFAHAADVYHMDYLAVTDHSNSLEDTAGTTNINDGSKSKKWLYGQEAANKATKEDFVGIYAYEMTWSNGTGHMNTFNTNGFENRNLAKYKTSTGLLEYYNALKKAPASISMFNHPGETFGDFNDFAHYDTEMDTLISLLEVGNGEGPIHQTGYFPSYEYYTRALDKGWHVAPTNNGDNHKGYWGDANTARTVILADSLTKENIYDAMKNMRVYATEDNNLNVYYTMNGEEMGTVLKTKPSVVHIKVDLEDEGRTPAVVDPNAFISKEAIGKIEVIANGGKVVASKTVTEAKETVEFQLQPNYSYYYIKVTQEDKDIAVTAPIWIGAVDKAGISKTVTASALPVKGEAIDITTTLFNNESKDMKIKSLEYAINNEVIHTADLSAKDLTTVKSLSEAAYAFQYTSSRAGSFNMDVKLVAELDGVEKIFTDVLKLKITDPSIVTKVVIDGSHRNDYVNGYYNGNMTNFTSLGAKEQVQVKIATEITDEVLADASVFMISAPLKKADFAVGGVTYNPQEFSDEFISTVKRYVDHGGNLIICGISDYQDYSAKGSSNAVQYQNDTEYQTSTQINKLLDKIGATTRMNNDQVVDDVKNGGQAYRLYFTEYNRASKNKLLEGIAEAQRYSFYSGCSILLDSQAVADGRTEWLVKGHPTTYSYDTKNTLPAVPVQKGDVYALAAEKLAGGGSMLIGGTVFTSNFEIKASEVDNVDDIYANSIIISNLLKTMKRNVKTTTIKEARKGNIGDVFAVEGYVTAGTAAGNAFFDTIYIQDETGGIDIFPVSQEGILPGQKMRIIGSLDKYQGDIELRVISAEKISEEIKPVAPAVLTTQKAMDYDANGGRLVKVQGKVTERIDANNSLSAFKVKDSSGIAARVLVDGYILDSTGKDHLDQIVKVGNQVSVTGIVYYNPDGVNLRVRDRAEIQLVSDKNETGSNTSSETKSTLTPTATTSLTPTTTVSPTPTPTPMRVPSVPAVRKAKTIYKGNTYQLEISNSNKLDKISFVSGNDNIACVDAKGKVTAKKAGTAIITTKVVRKNKTYLLKTRITVLTPKLIITKKTTKLVVGETFTFGAKVAGLNEKITWSVDNKKIAVITKNGKLIGKKVGKVTVTLKCGDRKVSIKVKVVN